MTLAVTPTGAAWGWGNNADRGLGVPYSASNPITQVNTPVGVGLLGAVVEAAPCGTTSFGLRSDGTVWHLPSLVAAGGAPSASLVVGLPAIASMGRSGTALVGCSLPLVGRDKTVWEMTTAPGGGGTGVLRAWNTTVRQITGLPAIEQVSCTGNQEDRGTCLAAASDGTVWAWGAQAGTFVGDYTSPGRTLPIQLPAPVNVADVHIGGACTLARLRTGEVWALQECRTFFDPVNPGVQAGLFPGLAGVVELSVGNEHAVVLKADGSVWSFGRNVLGAFGDGLAGNASNVPVRAVGINLN
ncbi:MAG: hypothetical protein JNL30_00075 [Rubrivivax sp.]|nr:hypothetical protein [Rubrivivax sp.]